MSKSKRRPQQKKVQNVQAVVSPESRAAQPAAPQATADTVTRTGSQTVTGAARHPYIADELKKIGILTAIMLVVLIILAYTLPRFI